MRQHKMVKQNLLLYKLGEKDEQAKHKRTSNISRKEMDKKL